VEITPPAGVQALKLTPSGAVPQSVSVGGALNLDNSGSTGAGAVLFSDQGAGALGRLLVVHQANPDNPQHAVRIQNAGKATTVSIYHDPAGGAGDATAEAVDIVSTNPLDTTLGVEGREQGRGTVKITHQKPAGTDAGAAALSIALEGAGTACQGIFIGNDVANPTTGNLLTIRNGGPGTGRLALTAAGRLQLEVQGVEGGILIGADTNLYRSAPGVLATDGVVQGRVLQGGSSPGASLTLRSTADAVRGSVAVEDELRLTTADKTVSNGSYFVLQAPPSSTVTLGPGGGLRGLGVAPAISMSGTLALTSLLMFNLNSVLTPSAPTNMQAVEVYKSNPFINGLPGVVGGVTGLSFSSFQHQLRLQPIAGGGTGSFASIFGFYSPPTINTVDAGWSVANYSLVRVEAPGGTGTITQLTGVDIRDFAGRGLSNYSLRSFGNAVHMRHSGGVSLGAQATPDTVLHLRGNPSVHGSLTVEEEATDPAAPAVGRMARVYVKNDKLVLQWNDGTNTLYTTIPLNSAGPYPAHPSVTTDIVAP
jgi:hypothetical protein